jgi:hypothetical protein
MRVVHDYSTCFPERLRADLDALRPRLGRISREVDDALHVRLDGEALIIPRRVAGQAIRADSDSQPVRTAMIACLMSRHTDGQIREANLRLLLNCREEWAELYVLLLLGDYVVEIVEIASSAILEDTPLAESRRHVMRQIVRENPELFKRLRAQCTSYWNAYQRRTFSHLSDYPGVKALDRLLNVDGRMTH